MKSLLTLLLALCLVSVKAQKYDAGLADTILHSKKGDFTLHSKDGKAPYDTIWTTYPNSIKNKPVIKYEASNVLFLKSDTPRFETVLYFESNSNGQYIMRIKKSNLKWLNDSTAVYKPLKSN